MPTTQTRPRDSQRQKLYNAERAAFGPAKERLSIAECQQLVDRVLRAYDVFAPDERITVTDGRGRRRGAYYREAREIRMPRFARCDWYVLHEIAHHLADREDEPAHGPDFAQVYLDLVSDFMGGADAERLFIHYCANGVKTEARDV